MYIIGKQITLLTPNSDGETIVPSFQGESPRAPNGAKAAKSMGMISYLWEIVGTRGPGHM